MAMRLLRFGLLLLFVAPLFGSDRGAGLQTPAATVAAQGRATQRAVCCDDPTPLPLTPPLSEMAQRVDDSVDARPPAYTSRRGLVPRLEPADSFQLGGLTRAPPRGLTD